MKGTLLKIVAVGVLLLAGVFLVGSAQDVQAGAGSCNSTTTAQFVSSSPQHFKGTGATTCTGSHYIDHRHTVQQFVWTSSSPPYGYWETIIVHDKLGCSNCSALTSSVYDYSLIDCTGIYDGLCCRQDIVTYWIDVYYPFNKTAGLCT